MLRVDNGVLIMDDNDYLEAVVYNLRPNVPITIEILEGNPNVTTPTSEGNYGPGDIVVFQVESADEEITLGKSNSDIVRFLITYEAGASVVTNLYEQQAIVPAAVSSQLDVTGEERIHIAPYEDEVVEPIPPDPDPPAGDCTEIYAKNSETDMSVDSPAPWLDESLPEASIKYLLITDAPSLEEFVIDQGNTYWYIQSEIAREGPDFYLTRTADWEVPWPNYGDPTNKLEVRGYLLDSPEDFSVGVLAEGCVHIELAVGAG